MIDYTPWEYLCIDVANNHHADLDKRPFEERIDWVQTHLDRLEEVTSTPIRMIGVGTRRKQIIHAFLNQMEKDIMFISDAQKGSQPQAMSLRGGRREEEWKGPRFLKVVRVNSILSNSENKIYEKFLESLEINLDKTHTVEL